MRAKYKNTCPVCKFPITPGEEIVKRPGWSIAGGGTAGKFWAHSGCCPPGKTAPEQFYKSLRNIVGEQADNWEFVNARPIFLRKKVGSSRKSRKFGVFVARNKLTNQGLVFNTIGTLVFYWKHRGNQTPDSHGWILSGWHMLTVSDENDFETIQSLYKEQDNGNVQNT
jgi:hypothetical protein